MIITEAELAELRKASEESASDYERRLAAEIVAMMPDDPVATKRLLAFIHAILNLELPPPSEDRPC